MRINETYKSNHYITYKYTCSNDESMFENNKYNSIPNSNGISYRNCKI